MQLDKTFLGNGWAFPPRFTHNGLAMVAAEQDIHESLLILLSTVPGERVMQPDYGCSLHIHVFASIDERAVAIIKKSIEKAILFFEPRVVTERIEISVEDKLEGKLAINIYYRVRATNNRYNLVYPFYFNEGTNVTL